jgi:hypothetical protein
MFRGARGATVSADAGRNLRACGPSDSRRWERYTRVERRARLLGFQEGKKYWRRGWESNQASSSMRCKLLKTRNATWDKCAKNPAGGYTGGTRGQRPPYSTGIDNLRAADHRPGLIGSEPKLLTTPILDRFRVLVGAVSLATHSKRHQTCPILCHNNHKHGHCCRTGWTHGVHVGVTRSAKPLRTVFPSEWPRHSRCGLEPALTLRAIVDKAVKGTEMPHIGRIGMEGAFVRPRIAVCYRPRGRPKRLIAIRFVPSNNQPPW